MKWFLIICLVLLLTSCTSHRVDSSTRSFVDSDSYVRQDARPAPVVNTTNTTNATMTSRG